MKQQLTAIKQQHTFFVLGPNGLLKEMSSEEHAAEMAIRYPLEIYFVADVVVPERQVMFYNEINDIVNPVISEEFAQQFAKDHDFGIYFFAEVWDVV